MKTVTIFETIGSVLAVGCALAFASMGESAPFSLVFSVYAVSSIVLGTVCYIYKAYPMMFLSVGYTVINLFGVVNNL